MGAFDWATEKVDEVDKVTTLADLSPAENARRNTNRTIL